MMAMYIAYIVTVYWCINNKYELFFLILCLVNFLLYYVLEIFRLKIFLLSLLVLISKVIFISIFINLFSFRCFVLLPNALFGFLISVIEVLI